MIVLSSLMKWNSVCISEHKDNYNHLEGWGVIRLPRGGNFISFLDAITQNIKKNLFLANSSYNFN